MAEFDNPPFDKSPVDGYACKAEDLAGASPDTPVILKVMEEVDAGQYSEREIQSGQAVRIMTGAAIPNGCNCCIYQENTNYGEDIVEVYCGQEKWDNYCFAGEDFKRNDASEERYAYWLCGSRCSCRYGRGESAGVPPAQDRSSDYRR